MNETTPPPGANGATGSGHRPEDRPHGANGFFQWVRGLGIERSASERWFAGVAGGIAAKAGIDPLIVRGVFVVLALLGGPGILLYLAGWLLLPDARGRIHLEDLFRGRASAGVIVAAVALGLLVVVPLVFGLAPALFVGAGNVFAWNLFGVPEWLRVTLTVIWWAVVVPVGIGMVIWWIATGRMRGGSSTRPDSTRPSAGNPDAASARSNPETWAERVGEQAGTWGQEFGEKAGAWGQDVGEKAGAWGEKVGADAAAWAERERERHQSRRPGAAQTVFSLALALLAGGIVAAWGLSTGAENSFVLTLSVAAAVAMLSLSMIVAGIRGRESGWIGFLAFIGVVVLVFAPFSTIMPENTHVQVLGPVTSKITGDSPEENGIVVLAGSATVDLTRLTAADAPKRVEVWVLAGNATIELPRSHPTSVRVELLAGRTDEVGVGGQSEVSSGPFHVRVTGANLRGADPADTTEVRVRIMAGNATVLDTTDASSGARMLEETR